MTLEGLAEGSERHRRKAVRRGKARSHEEPFSSYAEAVGAHKRMRFARRRTRREPLSLS